MKKYFVTILITVWLFSMLFCAETLAQCENCPEQDITLHAGEVKGQVIDSTGHPLTEAKVYLQPVAQVIKGRMPTTYTNKEGKFSLKQITPGQYLIHASKEAEGYPDTFFGFFVDNPKSITEVLVTANQITDKVVIRLGVKWTKLTGNIVDATTGKPIKKAQITFYRADNPDIWFSTQLKDAEETFQALVPKTFKIKVSSPGYKDWYYEMTTLKEKSDIFIMDSDSEKQIKISLQP